MNKILKILSILVIGFVMFSCSTPTNDPTLYIPEPSGSETPVETPTDDTEPSGPETPVETPSDDTEPSGPETPVETPSDDPVEETPEETTYSIIFIAEKEPTWDKPVANLLNSLPDYKNLKEGEKRELPTIIYLTEEDICTLDPTNCTIQISYEGDITSVVVENEDIKIKIKEVVLSEN